MSAVLDIGRTRGSVGRKTGVSSNAGSKEVKQERNGTTSQRKKGQEGGSPLVSHLVVHLGGEEDGDGSPEGTEESLGGEGGSGLGLVSVDYFVC